MKDMLRETFISFNVFQKRLSGVTRGTSMECLAFFLNRRLKFIDLQS